MAAKVVRVSNSALPTAGGIALLLLAFRGAAMAIANAGRYGMPVGAAALMGGGLDAIFGAALVVVALRKSQFTGVTAVIVATSLLFSFAFSHVSSLAFGLSAHFTLWTAIDLAIAGVIIWPSLFPWSSTANKPTFFWMGLTVAVWTLILGSLALLARL